MLTYLGIDNLALIEHGEIEFAPGFNVVTGETGAGKSVLLGAVSLLLGGRGDRSIIRTGAARCSICGIFRLKDAILSELAPILEKAGVPHCENGELQLKRVITENSGRCYLNDSPVTVHLLRTVGELLIDIHAANEHQSLIHPQIQLELLDRFANAGELKNQCADCCTRMRALHAERESFEKDMPSAAEAAHFQMLAEEIREVDPKLHEDEELGAKHELASHARVIKEDAGSLNALLSDGEDSVADRLSEAYRMLQELAKLAPDEGTRLLETCGVLSENVLELADAIVRFGDSVELDGEALAAIETRLDALYTLKRRYGPTLEQVLTAAEEAGQKAEAYRTGDARRREFDEKEKVLTAELAGYAKKLTALRKTAAEKFAAETGKKLAALGFAAGLLEAEWDVTEPGPNGQDRFEWLFSPNPGEPPRPLRKIASSGELSRIMLALKTVLADADRVPVSIFDEIDVNIGGETAVQVGEELRHLGKRRQILCISHLAQVAVQADRHFVVTKHVTDNRTSTSVAVLDKNGRKQEIARMLGGGAAALEHACKLLKKTVSHE